MEENKRIALVSAFVNPFIYSNSRVFSIADVLKKNGFYPLIITTNFDHSLKRKYTQVAKEAIYETILIDVPEYRKNLSILRLISHIVFAFKVRYFIKNSFSNYKFIYSTTPSTLAPFFLALLCKRWKKTFVLDVIDLWPESYLVFFKNMSFIFKFILFPWFLISRVTYRQSTLVIAESKEYARYVSQFRKDPVEGYYLGVDTKFINDLINTSTAIIPKKQLNEIWICYGGSLSNSYDFEVILSSFLNIQKQYKNTKLLFIGGGELQPYIINFISDFKINGLITGNIPYSDYLKWLSKCDIAINSFRDNTLVVHSYKYNDYIATGCCILNNLRGETWLSVEEHSIGLNFDYKENTLEKCLLKLLSQPELIVQCRSNSLKLANADLSKENIYGSVYKKISTYL